MLELIAQGPTIDMRWRRPLPGVPIVLGRNSDAYRVPWDTQISRHHVQLLGTPDGVQVATLPDAVNPVFFQGEAQQEFLVRPGEHFVIGATTFLVTSDQAFGSLSVPNPVSQKTFSSDVLQQLTYRDADRRIAVINRIPEIIANANDPDELMMGMINILMEGINSATAIGIAVWSETSSANPGLEILHWDRRGFERGDFQPSQKLVQQAVETQQSILNVWHSDSAVELDEFTFDYENDWAFASPLGSAATPGWSIYVAGRNRGELDKQASSEPEADLDGDIKFCELVGSTLKSLLQVNQLERQQASLRSFFSPVVVDAIGRAEDPDLALQPRQCDLAVLFCDLRGFSKTSEAMANDLLGLLERVSNSLGIMTRVILDQGGVIGDFHGDAVMGFWGWPLEVADPAENAAAAVQAAMTIREEFFRLADASSSWQDFQVGLGIATGHAVAGKIGSRDQVKVTAFGPVVNLASRLEGLNRWLGTQVLADQTTIDRIDSMAPALRPDRQFLGRYQPFGLKSELAIYQLLPPASLDPNTEDQFRQAWDRFADGDWDAARQLLSSIADQHPAARFLAHYLSEHSQPPSDFQGAIQMAFK